MMLIAHLTRPVKVTAVVYSVKKITILCKIRRIFATKLTSPVHLNLLTNSKINHCRSQETKLITRKEILYKVNFNKEVLLRIKIASKFPLLHVIALKKFSLWTQLQFGTS